jgi:hypothetical protein
MTVAMHGTGAPEAMEPGRPMTALVATPMVNAAPQAAAHKPGLKPARIGDALGLILPAVVLVGLFLIPAAQ